MTFFAEIFAFSFVAGTLGALLGIGGGLILIPFLTLVLDVRMHYAVGASIISVIATSSGSASAFLRDRLVNLRLGLFLNTATVAGAVAGALLAGLLQARWLAALFGLTLLYSAYAMLRSSNLEPLAERAAVPDPLGLSRSYYDPELEREVHYTVQGLAPALLALFAAGVISGMLGIGGGAFLVLVMDSLMRLPLKVSTTTSNFMIGVTAAAGSGMYFSRGDIHPAISAPVALGILAGTWLGTRLLHRIPSLLLRRVFVAVLLVTALQMIWKAWQGKVS